MKQNFAAVAALLVSSAAAAAWAQEAAVEGPGYKVSDGIVVHPSVGLETGFISNVFYTENEPEGTPLLRVLAQLGMGNMPESRRNPTGAQGNPGSAPALEFRTDIKLAYEEFLSSNENVQAQRDLTVGASLGLTAFPDGVFSPYLIDNFNRVTRPTNFESENSLDRDINHLEAGFRLKPGGGALSIELRYENHLDYFEADSARFANRLRHDFGYRTEWQFLPITKFYLDATWGISKPMESDSFKEESNPLRAVIGLASAITERVSTRLEGGFAKGFYETLDYTGVVFAGELSLHYSPTGRITGGYERNFEDSVNSQFYTEHMFKLGVDQKIRLVRLDVEGRTYLRTYEGIPSEFGMSTTREDTIFAVNAGAQYVYRDWLTVAADYDFGKVDTDFMGLSGDDPSYTRHEATLGVRASF
jgi:opacity protein-like surface antigen